MITVKITRAELVRHGACEGGLALFDRACELGGVECLEMEWTPLHDVWLAVVHSDFASWLRAEKIIPRADMSYADMSDANMRGADMSYADMSYANMRGAIWPADVPTPEGWRLVDGRLVRASWPSP